MNNLRHTICRGLSCIQRHGIVMVLVFAYLFTFVSHVHVDLGSSASAGIEIALGGSHIGDDVDRDDAGHKGGHHCHGWFPALTSVSAVTTVAFEMRAARFERSSTLRQGVQHGIDPPPPRILT